MTYLLPGAYPCDGRWSPSSVRNGRGSTG